MSSITSAPVGSIPQPMPLPTYHFTVEQYHRMIEAGVLTENDRVELLEGRIVPKMTHNPPHDAAVDLTQWALVPVLPAGWRVRVQSAITTADSEPEPDLAVVRGAARRYARSHPRPRDIALLVEVADTTLLEDRNDKCRLYARSRIPVYWIVNLVDSRLEVYTRPRAGNAPAYRERTDFGVEEAVPLVIAGQEVARIPVRELLP
jgi:Uma2 family endonuclease